MKKLLLVTALCAWNTTLIAQQTPNREGIGETPGTTTPSTPSTPGTPASPGNRDTARSDVPSDKTQDEMFIRKAGKEGKKELKMAELASTKASRQEVKDFAAMLVRDHQRANGELAEIAQSMGVKIPDASDDWKDDQDNKVKDVTGTTGQSDTKPRDPSGKDQKDHYQDLTAKSGADFDRAFLEVMGECHDKDIALFEKSKDTVNSPRLKSFIDKTLPVLKSHKEMVDKLDDKGSSENKAAGSSSR